MTRKPTKAQIEFGKRLRKVREQRDLTLDEIAKAAGGITPQAVEQWESGNTTPKQHRLVAVARRLDVELGWLLTGLDQDGAQPSGIALAPNTAGRTVPRLDWDNATDKNSAVEGVSKSALFTSFPCGPLSFALKITDRSNSPEYEPGDLIVIDPDLEPVPGDMVLALLKDAGIPIFRKYREVGRTDKGKTVIELIPLNDDWTADQIIASQTGDIIGVRSEHSRPRRP